MAVIEWIQFLAGGLLLLIGLVIFLIQMIGVFRFKYVLNRMHAAAMGDTLGIGCCLLGLILMKGVSFTALELLLVIIFLWFSAPVSSHLIARLEVATDEEPQKHYKQLAADANGEMTVLSERDREDKTEEEKEARNGAVL